MSNSNKIIIAILDFILCAVIGYVGMNALSRLKDNSGGGNASSATSSARSSSGVSSKSSSPVPARTAPFPETGKGESIVSSGGQAADNGVDLSSSQQPSAQQPSSQQPSSQQPSSDIAQTMNNNLGATLASTPEITSVSTPVYDSASNTYSFKVTATGQALTYTLADTKKKDLQSNGSGDFRVQPSASGKYYVYVTDSFGNKSDYKEVKGCYRPVKKITKEEFQQVLNSGRSQNAIDADFSNRVSSGCRYEFVGISGDEDSPKSYNEIIHRIRMKTWSSVTVLSVTHNSENNKLVRARIQVNY